MASWPDGYRWVDGPLAFHRPVPATTRRGPHRRALSTRPSAAATSSRPSPIAHRPSPIAHRPSPIVHRPSPIAHRPSSMAHRPWPIASAVHRQCRSSPVPFIASAVHPPPRAGGTSALADTTSLSTALSPALSPGINIKISLQIGHTAKRRPCPGRESVKNQTAICQQVPSLSSVLFPPAARRSQGTWTSL